MRTSILALLLAAAFGAAEAAIPLTEAQALRLGLARPEVADLARGMIDEARADALAAGLWANPALGVQRERINGSAAATEETWQLSQPIDLAGRRALRREAGERRVEAVESDAAGRRAELVTNIRRSFYDVLLREASVRATEAWVARFGQIEALVAKLEKAGEVSGYDRRRLARERHAASAKLAAERGELARRRETLFALIGSQGATAEGLSGTLLPTVPIGLEQALAGLNGRSDLKALAHKVEAFEFEGRAAARGWIPDVTLGIGTKRNEDGGSRQSGSLISVSVPLPVFDREQAGQSRAAAQARSARAEYRLALTRAEGELRGLHRQLEYLTAAADDYRRQAVASSGDLIRIAEAAYQAGESTLLELLDAHKGALEAETTALDLEWKAREARIEFDLLTGSLPE